MMLWWFHTTVSPPLLCQSIRFNPNLFFSRLQGFSLHQFLTHLHRFQGDGARIFVVRFVSFWEYTYSGFINIEIVNRCLSFINGNWFHPYKLRRYAFSLQVFI
ncbi:hypothetical protein Hanom_Chr02g00169671 [Helianthus anomalus]